MLLEQRNCLFDGQCVFDAEDAAAASLEAVQVGTASEGFAEVTGECTDICSLAACHPDGRFGQSEGGVVGHIDSAGGRTCFPVSLGGCWL